MLFTYTCIEPYFSASNILFVKLTTFFISPEKLISPKKIWLLGIGTPNFIDINAAATARSAAGSVILMPPDTEIYTSLLRLILQLVANKAMNIDNLLESQPITILFGIGKVEGEISTCISIGIALDPSIHIKIVMPGILMLASERKMCAGLTISFNPSDFISNIPISLMGPNLFLILLIILNWLFVSFEI